MKENFSNLDYQKRRNNDEVFFQKYIKPFKTIE